MTFSNMKVLAELIAAAGEAKAKSLKERISTAAKTRWEMLESIQEANVLGENADTIDLETAPVTAANGTQF
jgi:hypothetical protein